MKTAVLVWGRRDEGLAFRAEVDGEAGWLLVCPMLTVQSRVAMLCSLSAAGSLKQDHQFSLRQDIPNKEFYKYMKACLAPVQQVQQINQAKKKKEKKRKKKTQTPMRT